MNVFCIDLGTLKKTPQAIMLQYFYAEVVHKINWIRFLATVKTLVLVIPRLMDGR